MPSVAGIKGQPAKSMTQPAPEHDPPIYAPVDPKGKVAQPIQPIQSTQPIQPVEQIPEPPLTPKALQPPPSQDELADLSMKTQVVAKDAMTPSDIPSPQPPYTFTDADREAAAKAHWGKAYPWETAPLQDALSFLAEVRALCEKGGILLQKRASEERVQYVKCFGCENMVDISSGKWVTYRTRNNFETGLTETAYACSQACGLKLNRDFTHPVRIPQSAIQG